MGSSTKKTFEEVAMLLDKAGWSDKGIRIGGDNLGQVGPSLENCIDIVKTAGNGKKAEALGELHDRVSLWLEKLDAEQMEEAISGLQRTLEAATELKPNRRFYLFAAQELLRAIDGEKVFSGKIAESLNGLGKSIWPDFQLPGKE